MKGKTLETAEITLARSPSGLVAGRCSKCGSTVFLGQLVTRPCEGVIQIPCPVCAIFSPIAPIAPIATGTGMGMGPEEWRQRKSSARMRDADGSGDRD